MRDPVVGTTFCAQLVGSLMLVVHSSVPPSSKEWSAYCDYARGARMLAGGTLRTLVITEFDTGPNAGQRQEYKQKVAGVDNRVAVVGVGGFGRAILTAMSWFNPDIKPFALSELPLALSYLETYESEELRSTIRRFKGHL